MFHKCLRDSSLIKEAWEDPFSLPLTALYTTPPNTMEFIEIVLNYLFWILPQNSESVTVWRETDILLSRLFLSCSQCWKPWIQLFFMCHLALYYILFSKFCHWTSYFEIHLPFQKIFICICVWEGVMHKSALPMEAWTWLRSPWARVLIPSPSSPPTLCSHSPIYFFSFLFRKWKEYQ